MSNYTNEQKEESQETRRSKQLILDASEIIKPYGGHHCGTIALHFYACPNILLGKPSLEMITQKVNFGLSPDAAQLMMEAVRDQVVAAMGGKVQKSGPTTQGEIADTLSQEGQIVPTELYKKVD